MGIPGTPFGAITVNRVGVQLNARPRRREDQASEDDGARLPLFVRGHEGIPAAATPPGGAERRRMALLRSALVRRYAAMMAAVRGMCCQSEMIPAWAVAGR